MSSFSRRVLSQLSGQGCLFERERIWAAIRRQRSHNGDSGMAEEMGDLGFTQARGVIFKGQAALFFIHAEAAQAVKVGEFAEALKLLIG